MTLGENIAALRAQRGMSQGDLADALEVSRQSVSKWETDASIPELEKLLRLAKLFGITLDELVKGRPLQDEPTASTDVPASPHATVAVPTGERAHTRRVIGTILLCFGALIALLLLLLGGGLSGLLFGAPFFVCGTILLTMRRRAGLWCGWALYLLVVGYLQWATGLSWTTIFYTFQWTASMNYIRLAVAWGMALWLFAMLAATLRSFRALTIPCGKKQVALVLGGWVAVIAVERSYAYWLATFIRTHENLRGYDWVFTLGGILDFSLDLVCIALLTLTAALYRAWGEKRGHGK